MDIAGTDQDKLNLWRYGTNNNNIGNGGCRFKIYHDDLSTIIDIRMKFMNTYAKQTQIFDLTLFSQFSGATTIIEQITILPAESLDYTLRIRRINNNEIEFRRSSDGFATIGTTPTGVPYFNNTNFAIYSFAIGAVNNPPNDWLNSNPNVVLSAVLVTSILPNGVVSTSGSFTNSCAFNRVCIEGTYCDTLANVCRFCDDQCRDCASVMKNSCTKCHRSSPNFDLTYATPQQCTFDHVDFSKYDKFSMDVPPAMNYRVTFDFWMWVHDVSKFINVKGTAQAITLVYKDFLTIGIIGDGVNTITAYCFPMESYFQYNTTWTTRAQFDLFELQNFQKVKDTYPGVNSNWFHVRCAFRLQDRQMYINNQAPQTFAIPSFILGYNDFPRYFKKFWRSNIYTTLNIQGHNGLSTVVYIKNINIYNEYLPQNNDLKYHRVWDAPDIYTLPSLLFSSPFIDFVQDGITGIGNSSTYDFSGLKATTKQTSKVTLTYIGANLTPPKNFRRLYTVPLGMDLIDGDFSLVAQICLVPDILYCYDNLNTAQTCIIPGFLIDSGQCLNNPITPNTMRLPSPKPQQDNFMMNYSCPLNTLNCPNNFLDIVNMKNTFSCNAGFTNVYYDCIMDNVPNFTNHAFHFSGTLNTHSHQITLPGYSDSIISVWIHTDMSRQVFPMTQIRHFFLTDTYSLYWDHIESKFKIGIKTGAFLTPFDISSFLYFNGWNHLIVATKPKPLTVKTTSVYASIDNNFFKPQTFIGDIDENLVLTKICFCNYDWGINCCNIPSPVFWMDMFYKKMRVFDGAKINIWSVIEFENFSNDLPKSILHNFSFDLNFMLNDKLKDTITGIQSVVDWDIGVNSFNPDLDSMFNFANNFSWNDKNPGKYATIVTISGNKAVVSGSGDCNPACQICYSNQESACLKCNPGYGIIGSTCKRDSINGSIYYYKNPPTNTPASWSLRISNVNNINTTEPLTIFFYLKLFGFYNLSINDNIIRLHSLQNLIFHFRESEEALVLSLNGTEQFKYSKFQSEFFGKWCPISIAMYRSSTPLIFPHMASVTIGFTTLSPLDLPFKIYSVDEFRFMRDFIGYVSNVNFYFKFIINSFGYASHYASATGNLAYLEYSFNLKSNLIGGCLSNSEIMLPDTTASIGLVCISDYNPYYDHSCQDNEAVFLNAELNGIISCESKY